ncbi:helix-turn-helix domain-containing protein [Limnobaculum xujianqingii]|uniref:helix-turn-helix transcriptional regulator n=1 Tax=Limnobaculum xujianqingii TaxID=2738837 RepID=UPI00112D19C0|nr:helix-turn-helix transcriptional regulator [Limnobaculum xujianqingii]
MSIRSINYAEKLKAIRIAEYMSQEEFSLSTGMDISVIKDYEDGGGLHDPLVIERLILMDNIKYRKYVLWLAIGQIAYEAGQIDPALSHYGPEKTMSHH